MNTDLPIDSIQKLADFWDTHDLTEFETELEEVTTPVFIHETVLNIPLSLEEANQVREIAGAHGLSVTELLHRWVVEQIHGFQQRLA